MLSRALQILLLGGQAASAAAGISFDYYVDSVNGLDANAGTSAGAAKQTIGALPALAAGQSVGLARGSYWREQLTDTVGVTVGPYGTGAPPVIDGADIATGWTQPDVVTYPNVWSRSWTRASVAPTSTEFLGLWADGVRPRFASSLADLQTNGGWYATSRVTASSTIYIKSATDPNTSGVVYEVGKRDHAILSYAATGTSTVSGLELKRCLGHYNALAMGAGAASKMLLRDGTIHHIVTQAALTEDVILTEIYKNASPIPIAAYRSSGTGFEPLFRRLFCLFGASDARTAPVTVGLATITHDSGTGADRADADQCIFDGINGMELGNSRASLVKNSFFKNIVSLGLNCNGNTELRRLMFFDNSLTGHNGGVSPFRFQQTITGGLVTDVAVFGTKGANAFLQGGGASLPVTKSAFVTYNGAGPAIYTGSMGFTYNVVDTSGESFGISSGTTYVGDYNIWAWWRNGGSAETNALRNAHPIAGNVFTLAQWQAATSQDTHSVGLKKSEQVSGGQYALWLGMAQGTGGPEVGDFRINPGARVYGGDGTMYVGTFTDGTPITLAGPQEHWNFNTRSVVAGPPSVVPTPPATLAEMRTYIADPEAWNFYP